jgi:hypothetical protein
VRRRWFAPPPTVASVKTSVTVTILGVVGSVNQST